MAKKNFQIELKYQFTTSNDRHQKRKETRSLERAYKSLTSIKSVHEEGDETNTRILAHFLKSCQDSNKARELIHQMLSLPQLQTQTFYQAVYANYINKFHVKNIRNTTNQNALPKDWNHLIKSSEQTRSKQKFRKIKSVHAFSKPDYKKLMI
ncbi:hypothetical protein L6164_001212 [Bauhinia variegata]|uniref:Uncharacterized protein n=1 Tax=Bauhinia variegata TaxID=167791 RepID=A0ACB9Q8S2_BAUVA|nr:hypothetical protein L6164_001212 [Bauhinia variegata]